MRSEIYDQLAMQTANLKEEEKSRISDIDKATKRKDDIQKQIDHMNYVKKLEQDAQVKLCR